MIDQIKQLFVAAILLVPLQAQDHFGMSGRIMDGVTGDPVVGATVLVLRDTGQPVKGGPDFQTAITGDDGTYAIPELANGHYRVCVQTIGYLDPCGGRPEAYVRGQIAGKSATLNLSLQRAKTIRIVVEDPAGYLEAREGKVEGSHLLIGVVDESQLFRPLTVMSANPTMRVYEGQLRPGSSARVLIHSEAFSLSDSSGSPIPGKGASLTIEASEDGDVIERAVRIRE